MTLETWLTYVAGVLLLMSTPGPSQLLMMANSIANGFSGIHSSVYAQTARISKAFDVSRYRYGSL